MTFNRRATILAAVATVLAVVVPAGADWPTHRGNPQRTGSIDDQQGPAAPAVLWAYKAPEHYVASPVPEGDSLFVSGLGAFNTGAFHSLATAAQVQQRLRWSKIAPFLKRPTVCSPAVAEGLIIFGDGMHQTDGAVLYALDAAKGLPVWQLPVPGKLVHLEGGPTIDKGRVYIGAGEAGIICADVRRLVLDGKDVDLAGVQAIIEKRWAELAAKFEEDRKKDPTFAVPPSEDALPKPAPKVVWHKGQGVWHVDAPVAVAGDRVIAASAYIDEEKVGKRVLVCLGAADGATLWETPLKVNPWAGPTVAGNLVLAGCSTIRFDRKLIKGAKGEVVAADLASGQIKWRVDVPGGVLSPVAVKGDLAVFAATDGKVRAVNLATGQPWWEYDAGAPFFGGPAIAGPAVYAADLKAVLHAVALADGKPIWKMDVAADPAARAPGMVYGCPVVVGGRIYLATCNLESEAADQPSMVVCIAEKSAVAAEQAAATVAVDKKQKTVTISCRVAPRKLPNLKEIYPLEVVATQPAPAQKAHETVVVFDVRPSDVHKALESLGLKPGKPAKGEEGSASGPQVKVFIEVPGAAGKPRVVPIEKTMIDKRTGRPMPPLQWFFTGSVQRQPDPNKPDKVYGADLGGTLIALFPVTDETVLQTNLTMRECNLLKLETNPNVLPEEGTPVKLIIAAGK